MKPRDTGGRIELWSDGLDSDLAPASDRPRRWWCPARGRDHLGWANAPDQAVLEKVEDCQIGLLTT